MRNIFKWLTTQTITAGVDMSGYSAPQPFPPTPSPAAVERARHAVATGNPPVAEATPPLTFPLWSKKEWDQAVENAKYGRSS